MSPSVPDLSLVPLYVIYHVPKTAGQSLRRMLKETLPPDEIFEMYEQVPVYDPITRVSKCFSSSEYETQLRALNHHRPPLKVIMGHQVFYGVHHYFDRPVRYVCFVREPMARTLSLYNFRVGVAIQLMRNPRVCEAADAIARDPSRLKTLTQDFPDVVPGSVLDFIKVRDNFLVRGQVPSFSSWLEHYNRKSSSYVSGLDMVEFLIRNKFFEWGKTSWKEAIHMGLRNFFFIGMQESFAEDCRYLFSLLGIDGGEFATRANASRPHVDKISWLDQWRMRRKNKRDSYLYEAVLSKRQVANAQSQPVAKILNPSPHSP